jgi:hypothetical protein
MIELRLHIFALLFALLASTISAVPFGLGNFVALRVGNGASALNQNATAVYLDEINNSTGATVQSILLPIVLSGTDYTTGALSRSADGVFIIVTGFMASVNTPHQCNVLLTTPPGSGTICFPNANRAIVRIDPDGVIETTELSPSVYNGVISGACSYDGSGYYIVGNSTIPSSNGVAWIAHGGSTPNSLFSTIPISASSDWYTACSVGGPYDGSTKSMIGNTIYLARRNVVGYARGNSYLSYVLGPVSGGHPQTTGTFPVPTFMNAGSGGTFLDRTATGWSYLVKGIAAGRLSPSIFAADINFFDSASLFQSFNGAIFRGVMAASTPFDRLTYPLGSFVQASNMYANGHWAQGVALSLDETRAYWAGKKGIYFADSRIQRALPLATALTPTGTQIGVDLAANMEYRGFERAPFVECRSGFFRPAGIVTRLSSCLACPSGTYSDYGSAGCPTCPAGAYCLGAGTPSFIPCPGATYNPNTGSSSLSACLACPAGTFSPLGSSSLSQCVPCSPGTFSSGGSCQFCPANTFSALSSSTSCTACPAGTMSFINSTSCFPLRNSFKPGNVVALRLTDQNVQTWGMDYLVAAWIDEFEPTTSGGLNLVRSVPLPNGTTSLPAGQYSMNMHVNDLQNIHDQQDAGMITLTQDSQGIVVAGIAGPIGKVQPIFNGPCCASVWAGSAGISGNGGASNYLATDDMVVGTVDFNTDIDISTIAGRANSAANGPAAFVYAAIAPCVPSFSTCRAGGFIVSTNAYANAAACGQWYVPYKNSAGFTGATGTGSFSWALTCSSNGGGRTMAISYHGFIQYMYYYSGSYMHCHSVAQVWPPTARAPGGGSGVGYTTGVTIAYTNQAAMGYRGYLYVIPPGSRTYYYVLADLGFGLHVFFSSTLDAATWTPARQAAANWAELYNFHHAPNNDHALIGVTSIEVNGRTIIYASSKTGRIYSFDLLTLQWLNNGFPVFSFGGNGLSGTFHSYRGMADAPAPDSRSIFCFTPPGYQMTSNMQNPGTAFINKNLVIINSTFSTNWARNAQLYTSVLLGCMPGFFGPPVNSSCHSVTGWNTNYNTTCLPCTANAGFYCPPGSTMPSGVICPPGFVCPGGSSDLRACNAAGGFYCPAGTAVDIVAPNGHQTCPVRMTCNGVNYQPVAPKPFLPDTVLVVRLGDGVIEYTGRTFPVFIDEFDTTTLLWTLVQTIMLPTYDNGQNKAFSLLEAPGGAVNRGFLTRSADSRYVTLAGYAAPPGTTEAVIAAGAVQSVVARIDFNGNIDTSTSTVYNTLASGVAYGLTSAATYDGTGYLMTGDFISVATGNRFPVLYQNHGISVNSLGNVFRFSNPASLSSVPSSSTLSGGFPFVSSVTDNYHQAKYVKGKMYVSHTWTVTSPTTAGDITPPNVPVIIRASTRTDIQNVSFNNRLLWESANVRGVLGFTILDNNQRILLCDRLYGIKQYWNQASSSALLGVGTTVGSTSATNYNTLTCVDASCPCFAMDSRENDLWFTTDRRTYFLTQSSEFMLGNGPLGTGNSRGQNAVRNTPQNLVGPSNERGGAVNSFHNKVVYASGALRYTGVRFRGTSLSPVLPTISGSTLSSRPISAAFKAHLQSTILNLAGTTVSLVEHDSTLVELHCSLGRYGAPITLGPSNFSSISSITCSECSSLIGPGLQVPLPAPSSGITLLHIAANKWLYSCGAGFFNNQSANAATGDAGGTAVCNPDAAVNPFGVVTNGCTACPKGSFCPGDNTIQPCAAGFYGDRTGLSTPTCSGPCPPGYFCPNGTAVPTANPCGSAAFYCPQGSSAPVACVISSISGMSTPFTGPAITRTGCSICPPNRLCNAGQLVPGTDFGNYCPSGAITMYMNVTGVIGVTDVGMPLIAATPGWTVGSIVNYNISAVSSVDPACNQVNVFSYNINTYMLTLQQTGADFSTCINGYSIIVTAERLNDPFPLVGEKVTPSRCVITMKLSQPPRVPKLTCLPSVAVDEFSLLGTVVPKASTAVDLNAQSSLSYSIASFASVPSGQANPFYADTCTGELKTVGDIYSWLATQYIIELRVDSDGNWLKGSFFSTCTFTVNVTRVNIPPVLTVTSFNVEDLPAVGGFIGNVMATDRNVGDTVTGFRIVSHTYPTGQVPFAISNTGVLTYALATLDAFIAPSISVLLNFTDGTVWTTQTISFRVSPAPRPPSCLPQFRNITDNRPIGSALSPPLVGSRYLNVSFQFSIIDSTGTFAVNRDTGVLTTLKNLNFNAVNSYSLSLILTDCSTINNGECIGLSNFPYCPVTITIIETNVAPTFSSPTFSISVPDGSSPSTAVGDRIPASDTNPSQSITYSITSCLPLDPRTGRCSFTVDAFGQIFYSGPVDLLFNESLVYPTTPRTYNVILTATDSGVPRLSASVPVGILVSQIRPRITPPVGTIIPRTAVAGTVILNLNTVAITWFPLTRSNLRFFQAGPVLTVDTGGGESVFVISDTAGTISLSTPAPTFNFNNKSTFIVPVFARDFSTGATSATVNVIISLQHFNRPPSWSSALASANLVAPMQQDGVFGVPLQNFVVDPDTSVVGITESFSFSVIRYTGMDNIGNFLGFWNAATSTCISNTVGAASARVPGNGQLCITTTGRTYRDFVFTAPVPTTFEFLISVSDAGVNGASFSANATIVFSVGPNLLPNTIGFFNLTIVEHSPVASFVNLLDGVTPAVLFGASPVCTTTDTSVDCIENKFSFDVIPRGENVNKPWPFYVTQIPAPLVGPWQNTPFNTRLARAQLRVGSDGPIHFSSFNDEGEFRVYYGTVVLTDNRIGVPNGMVATNDIQINVLYKPEPPFFSPSVVRPPATASQLNSHTFTIQVPEKSPGGTNFTFADSEPARLTARSKDPWAVLRYSWDTASATAWGLLFVIDSVTGQVSLASGSAPTNFNTRSSYSMTVRVVDQNGLTDTATVSIKIIDVNDAAVFLGVWDGSNSIKFPTNAITISEAATIGTRIAYLRYSDEDVSPVWGAKTYEIVSGADSLFQIDSNTGAVSVIGELQWLDKAFFSVIFSEYDRDPYNARIVYSTVNITLTQATRIQINSFSSVAATAFAPNSVADFSSSVSDVVFSTAGSTVDISGKNFGYTAGRMAREGLAQLFINVTFGPVSGFEYPISSCVYPHTDTSITCTVPPGIGKDLTWRVGFGSFVSDPSSRRTSYLPPTVSVIETVTNPSINKLNTSADTLGQRIRVQGANFGPALMVGRFAPVIRLYYGQPGEEGSFITGTCTIVTIDSVVTCPAAAGFGSGLSFKVYVGFLSSATTYQSGVQSTTAFTATTLAYFPPLISMNAQGRYNVIAVDSIADTRGGSFFEVSGLNFGPIGTSPITVQYSVSPVSNSAGSTVFETTLCVVSDVAPHRLIRCKFTPGVGSNFYVRVIVGNQAFETPSTSALAYTPPVILFDPANNRLGLSGFGLNVMPTTGGTTVEISGDFFGPIGSSPSPSAVYGKFSGSIASLNRIPRSCVVVIAHTLLRCIAGEGSGAGLVWAVNAGGQYSNVLRNVSTSYSPPSIQQYSGAGVTADTTGNQGVNISGVNFGPAGTPINLITYGATGSEFTAKNCRLLVPHILISCDTVVGAGTSMSWVAFIDGQRSVSPTTTYLPPLVESFSGPGASDASTEGKQTIVITGRYFSTNSFLGKITYGPSGNEYTASNCNVTTPHTAITCTTVPGTGRKLIWSITVGNQTTRSSIFTSYAAPKITSLMPMRGPTAGNIDVVVTGENLGLLSTSEVEVRMNSVGTPIPMQYSSYWNRILAGEPDDLSTSTALWIRELPKMNPFNILGATTMSFSLPEGYGLQRQVFVVVGGVPSNIILFNYSAPFISNLSPDRVNTTVGYLRLNIEGDNFCNGINCAVVTVDGQIVTPSFHNHDRIIVTVPDPAGQTKSVKVTVGGVDSNIASYSAPVPSITNIGNQANYGGGAQTVVENAALMFSIDLMSSKLTPTQIVSPLVGGPFRAAIANKANTPVGFVDIVAVTDVATGATTNVAITDVVNTVNAARRLAAGVKVAVEIDISSTVQYLSFAASPANVAALEDQIVAALNSSSLASAIVTAVSNAVRNAYQIDITDLVVSLDSSSISKTGTVKSISSGSAMKTSGGDDFLIKGVMSLATVSASQIAIYIGPFQCVNVVKSVGSFVGGDYGVNIGDPIASEYFTYDLSCKTPPGIGSKLPIRVKVPGGVSAADPNFVFTYTAPSITDIKSEDGLTSYSALLDQFNQPVNGFSTTGGSKAVITGFDLGTFSQIALVCGLKSAVWTMDPPLITPCTNAEVFTSSQPAFSVTLIDELISKRVDLTGTANITNEVLSFSVPPGQGKNIQISLMIGGQTDTDALPGGTVRAPANIRYLAPVVTLGYAPYYQGGANPGAPTTGLTPFIVTGSNFGSVGYSGSEFARPKLTIGRFNVDICGPSNCRPLFGAYEPDMFQSEIQFFVKEGWGKDLPIVVTVAGQSSVSKATYSFAAPIVNTISPTSGSTSGLTPSGSKVIVTVTGSNFGLDGSVVFEPTTTDATSVPIFVPHTAALVWNHTHVVFHLPEGAGSNLNVRVNSNGHNNTKTSAKFSYDPPKVFGVGSNDGSLKCSPTLKAVRVARGDGKSFVVQKAIYPTYAISCFPTSSDPFKIIRISGESFGAPALPVLVSINGKVCSTVSHSHTYIDCNLPNGIGEDVTLSVVVGGRSNLLPSPTFSYDPPIIRGVTPNRPNAINGEYLEISGHNFGPFDSPVKVLIGGLPCGGFTKPNCEENCEVAPAKWLNDGRIGCTAQPDVVGTKNISIVAANRSTPAFYYESEEGQINVEYRCPKDSTGLRGEVCAPCFVARSITDVNTDGSITGAFCPGNELDFDLAVSLPGFWRFNSTEVVQCASKIHERRALQPRTDIPDPGCPVFVACEPFESCLGKNKCSPVYRGERCQDCAERFYRVNGMCIKCPDSPWATVVVFLILALGAMFAAYMLNSKNVNLALISIGVDWAQVVAMFARTRIAWPQLVKDLFLLLSAFNFNLELIAPECAIPSVTYAGKWLFVEGMPLFAWLCLFLVYVFQAAFKSFVMGRSKKDIHSHIYGLIATGVVVQRVLYLYMTRSTLDIFNCAPSNPPDYDKSGNVILYMAWNLSIKCNEPGGTHLFLLPFAAFALAIYVIGVPVASLWWLWKNKEVVTYDQMLRAQLTGDEKTTNPNFNFRNTWKALYMNYRPGTWYWEFIICIRKFLIAFVSLMFRATPTFQLAMALLVLFIAYVAQVRMLPYLSHSVASETTTMHRRLVLEGNVLHTRIDEEMKSRAAYYKRTSVSKTNASSNSLSGKPIKKKIGSEGPVNEVDLFYAAHRSRFENQLLEGRSVILKNGIANFIFDYNTAEAVLLSSAILVNLAGISFDSTRFANGANKGEYDSLAYAIIIVLFLSIIYWLLALGLDILLISAPQSVSNCLHSASAAASKIVQQAQATAGVATKSKVNQKKVSRIKENDDPLRVETVINPSLVRAAEGSTPKSPVMTEELAAVISQQSPPDQIQWANIKALIAATTEKSGLLAAENELLRSDSNSPRALTKKSFGPTASN